MGEMLGSVPQSPQQLGSLFLTSDIQNEFSTTPGTITSTGAIEKPGQLYQTESNP